MNSSCHDQALWVERASPPPTHSSSRTKRVWAWGLPSSTPTSSHVPDWTVTCDGLVQPWLAACLPGGRGKVGIGRDEPWPGLRSAGTCLFAEPRVSGVPHSSLLSHEHVAPASQTPVSVSPPPAPHAVRSSAGTYEAEEGLGCGTCRAPPLPHQDWGPSTDLSPEPRMWPEPPQDRPLSAFLCLSPGFCSRVSGSPANFSITLFPPSVRTSPHFFQPSH